MKNENLAKKDNSNFFKLLKAIVLAVTFSLIFLLIFALVVRFIEVSEKVVLPINQFIKIFSLFLGCVFGLRNTNKGFIKGLFIGIIYAILCYLIFSILSGEFLLKITTFTDILFCGVIGGCCGIISVNLKKS